MVSRTQAHHDRLAGLAKHVETQQAEGAAKPTERVQPPLSVRMPDPLRRRLAAEAARRSIKAGRTITSQAVILDLLDRELPHE